MNGRPCKPAPEGFFEFAATHGRNKIVAKFGIGTNMIDRLISTMPPEWIAERTALMNVNRRRGGAGLTPEQSAAIHAAKKAAWYQANKERLAVKYAERRRPRAAKKAAASPKEKTVKGPAQKPVPDGFFEYVLHHTYVETGARFGCSTATVNRFIAKMPDDQRAQVMEAAGTSETQGWRVRHEQSQGQASRRAGQLGIQQAY
jgi:hypothetical protein